MDRRTFLKSLGVLGLATLPPWVTELAGQTDKLGTSLPRRQLGRSGESITLIGLGGYHIGWTTEALAQATIEAALEEGVRFFDTAESYGAGRSEERYGKFLVPRYRDEIFLMTKTLAKDAKTAQSHLEESLRRLKTDRLDLWQIHALTNPADVDERIRNGVVEVALKAQTEGKVRHLGFTGHADPYAHLRMLERFPEAFAAAQMPVNPVDFSSRFSFIKLVLPKIVAHGLAPLAMKSLADGRFFAKKIMNEKVQWETADPIIPTHLSLEEVTQFVLSLPVSTLIVGAEKPEFLREKVAFARRLHALDATARERLAAKVSHFAEVKGIEYYKSRVLPAEVSPTESPASSPATKNS